MIPMYDDFGTWQFILQNYNNTKILAGENLGKFGKLNVIYHYFTQSNPVKTFDSVVNKKFILPYISLAQLKVMKSLICQIKL